MYPYRPHRTSHHLIWTTVQLLQDRHPIGSGDIHNRNATSSYVAVTKMDKAAEALWWRRMHRELQERQKNCSSGGAAGKNPKMQRPHTEDNN